MKKPSKDIMNSLSRSVLTLYSYDDNADDTTPVNVLRQSMQLISMFPLLSVYGYQAYRHYHEEGSYEPNYLPEITMGNSQNEAPTPNETTPFETSVSTDPVEEEAFAFLFNEVALIPNAPFDAKKLPAAASTYVVPSCALEGTDNVYNYEAFEVTAYNEGKGEFIYSIYFIDPNLTTPEGLAIGDDLAKAVSIYGEGYTQTDASVIYTKGHTQLILILQEGTIVSIEYRMVTE